MKKHTVLLSLAWILTLTLNQQAHALGKHGQLMISPRIGYERWDQTRFNIHGNQVDFDSSEYFFGVNAMYRFNFGIALGGEFMYTRFQIDNDNNVVNPGYANSYNGNLVVQYHMFPKSRVQPFIGVGLGYRKLNIHSFTNANLNGPVTSVNAGIVFHIGDVERTHGAVHIEFKRSDFDLDDASGATINTKSDMFIIGGAINF